MRKGKKNLNTSNPDVRDNLLTFPNWIWSRLSAIRLIHKQKRHSADWRNEKSVFMQQSGMTCYFNSSDSWVILSPIEQSIKRKIEAVGTPLKDWDIQINYGIKTGYNDAFIIDTAKRDEILANCHTEDESQRAAELNKTVLFIFLEKGSMCMLPWVLTPFIHANMAKNESNHQCTVQYGAKGLDARGRRLTHQRLGEGHNAVQRRPLQAPGHYCT